MKARKLGKEEGTGLLWAPTKRRRCRSHSSIHPQASGPPPHPQKFQRQPLPKPSHKTFPLAQIQPSFLKANMGKSLYVPFARTKFLPAHGKALVFSFLLFRKEKPEKAVYNLPYQNQSAASQSLLGRGPSRMHKFCLLEFGRSTSPLQTYHTTAYQLSTSQRINPVPAL